MRRIVLNRHNFIKLSESVLSQHGCLRFEAYGSSMYPFIRSGDILTIQPTDVAALNVGDVAFYRGVGDRLVAHRVVGKHVQDNHIVLTMRGDAASGPGEQIRATQVLGQVVSVQRGQKSIRMASFFSKSLQAFSKGLRCLQQLRLYRSLARRVLHKHICYRVAGAEDAHDCWRLYSHTGQFGSMKDPSFLKNPRVRGDQSKNFAQAFSKGLDGHILIASVRGRIAGAIVIRQFSENTAFYSSQVTEYEEFRDWWLFGLLVRTRYRGAGIGEGLVHMALQEADKENADKVNLMVSERNKVAVNLYRKMGFRQTSTPALDGQLNERVWQGDRQYIIMSLNLSTKGQAFFQKACQAFSKGLQCSI